MRLAMVSAKGSPGVTTLALTMAATTGGMAVEADPAGGDVECWAGPRGEPGLIQVAGMVRHTADAEGVLDENALNVWPGVRAVLAPVGAGQAESTLMAIGDRLAPLISADEGWVLVDGGRWARSQPTARRLIGCDMVGVVLSPTVVGVAHARPLIDPLGELFGVPVVAVVVGERGYTPVEIAHELGVPVVGVVAWDRRGVETLLTVGASRWWRRSPLARSVRSLVDALEPLAVGAVSGRG